MSDYRDDNKIPTGLVVAGPSISQHASMFESLAKNLQEQKSGPIVLVTSADAPNLKTLLKKIIRKVTKDTRIDDDKPNTVVWEILLRYRTTLTISGCKLQPRYSCQIR
jgi:Origin recognition complex (ORC) subunit 3 N-terminus